MKTFVTATILFFAVLALVIVNYFILGGLFEDIEHRLDAMPTKLEDIEALSESERAELLEKLREVKHKWESHEAYLYVVLDHAASRVFFNSLLPAISYCESGEDSQFLAELENAKNAVRHIRFDEGVKVGNLM